MPLSVKIDSVTTTDLTRKLGYLTSAASLACAK